MEGVLVGPGTVLAGRYAIERELGRGGTACVYLARDLKHRRDVAVKILHRLITAQIGSDRFLREIEVAARLTHPHILPLHDSGETDDLLYYVMPFVEGESLRERLVRDGPLPLEDALRITREVADALAYAHAHGVVHRDIKPGNILLEAGHAVVADFGIARAVTYAGGADLTTSGLAIGTPVYMSPEQVSGSTVDGRTDLYSLGCVLYEMLTGSPPFSGPTPQAVAARHLYEPPRPLETILPLTPKPVARAVNVALQKNPDDRFPTAGKFMDALAGNLPGASGHRARFGKKRVAILGAAAALVLVPLALRRSDPPLDPGRIIVYPASNATAQSSALAPDEVTLALLASLNSTASLVGVDGARLPGASDVTSGGLDGAGRQTAREQRAGFYVTARLLGTDSLHLLLDLHDVQAGTVTRRALDFPPGASGWSVGVRAALELLPVLIPTGGRHDLPSLQGRSPKAMAAFFQGERAYRSAAFEEALGHFRTAVEVDSSFALAALRGAMVASWSDHPDEARAMARVAVSREATLPARLAHLAHGVEDFMTGRADSAVGRFRQALALDPENAEAWMGLAETLHHLLPREAQLDSLAEDAYLRVRLLDPEFAPAMFHLIEYAVRRGDLAGSERLMERFTGGHPDAEALGSIQLMLDCVRGDMTRSKWEAAVLRNPAQALGAGQLLSVGGLRQPDCAEAAFEAVLAFDTTGGQQLARHQFGALIGLQGVLVARGRHQAARALLDSDTLFNPRYRGALYLMNAMAGLPFIREAEAFAGAQLVKFRREPSSLSSLDLWFLGGWEAYRGRAELAAEIADTVSTRNAAAGNRRDSLLVASLAARVALARGDSSGALDRFRRLVPTADDAALVWNPWEALGAERLLLARLLLAKGEALAALQVASNFDAPSPVTYLPYLPASLVVRIEAAGKLGDEKLLQRLQRRQRMLESNTP
jgi:eukaryotic-like serine/threonine-protein kinase